MGDICLYQNFQQLSDPCQKSIADLHILRAEYWREDSFSRHHGPHHHPHGFHMLYFLALLLLTLVTAKLYRKRYIKRVQMMTIISAIESNPALKAQGMYWDRCIYVYIWILFIYLISTLLFFSWSWDRYYTTTCTSLLITNYHH